jgi:hypothetical protein
MARVYADVNAQMPRAYWDYDSVNISWGALENYEVVKKIGTSQACRLNLDMALSLGSILIYAQVGGNIQRFSKASTS